MKPLWVGAAAGAWLCTTLAAAAPPQIGGGAFLSSTTGVNPQIVRTYERSALFDVTLLDPDPGQALSYSIQVAGPIGGIEGGTLEGSAASGIVVHLPVRFIAGVTPGTTWIRIDVTDGAGHDTRFINFDVQPHPSPPPGELFGVSHGDASWKYHFVVLITDPVEIQRAHDILAGIVRQQVISGSVVKGNGGFNVNQQDPERTPWSWHYDPASVLFAEAFPEVCDGSSCLIEYELPYWVNQIGQYCPWTTFLVPHIAAPPVPAVAVRVEETSFGTVLRWDPIAGAQAYDVARGSLGAPATVEFGCRTDLGVLACIASNLTALNTESSPDAQRPPSRAGYFYVVRYDGQRPVGWGTASTKFIREGSAGCP